MILLTSCVTIDPNNRYRYTTLESFNRTMFNFNYYILDNYMIRLVAIAWRDYMPISVRNGLINFLSNLEEPTSMVNSILRGDIYQGVIHLNRFFLNTVFGMVGFIDIASMANSKLIRQDTSRFGSTLGYYQVGYGPYIVLPCYGSFTLREDIGDFIDKAYPMLSYLNFWMSIGKWILEGIEKRAILLNFDSFLINSSDPYLAIKEAYFQNKDFKIQKRNLLKPIINSNARIIEKNLDFID